MPIVQQRLFEDISHMLGVLRYEIEHQNKLTLRSVNIVAEDFYARFLNCVYGWDLINANKEQTNAPGIDLIDKSRKIVVQVSVTKDRDKIQHSIDEFIEKNKAYKDALEEEKLLADEDPSYVKRRYRLIMLILTEKQKRYTNDFELKGKLRFNKENDIWDITDILADIENIGDRVGEEHVIEKWIEIAKFLHKELDQYDLTLKKTEEKEATIIANFSKNTDKILGREELLRVMQEQLLAQGEVGNYRCLFLKGFGGAGKSVLAKEYAALHQDEYDEIVEVSGESFKEIIRKIPLKNWESMTSDPEGRYQECKLKITEITKEKKILVIVHDYNVTEDEAANWYQLSCDWIITTWNDWHEIGPQIDLSDWRLSEDSAYQIFVEYYMTSLAQNNHPDTNQIQSLLKKQKKYVISLVDYVEMHPLSIKLLAKQMTCKKSSVIMPKEMMDEIRKMGIPEMPRKQFPETHVSGNDSKVIKADAKGHLSAIFLTALSKGVMDQEQTKALRYMMLVSPVYGISVNRFKEWTKLDTDLLDELEQMGWLEYSFNGIDPIDNNISTAEESDFYLNAGTFRLPMIIGEVLCKEERLKNTIENAGIYIQKWREYKNQILDSYLKTNALKEQSLILGDRITSEDTYAYADLLDEVSFELWNWSDMKWLYEKASSLKKTAIQIREKLPWEKRKEPIRSLAKSYYELGYMTETMVNPETGKEMREEGIQYKLKAIQLMEKHFDPKDEDTARYYNSLGYSYCSLEQYSNAFKYLKLALDIRLQLLGPIHADVAMSYNDLAYANDRIGNIKKAIEYKKAALEIRQKALGENHGDTATSYNNLGETYERIKNTPDVNYHSIGLSYKEKALEIRRKIYGEYHITTASSYNTVGRSYRYKKETEEKGLEYIEKALEIRRIVLGENSTYTAKSYNNVGLAYLDCGKYEEAETYIKRALEIRLKSLPSNHTDIAQSYTSMGMVMEKVHGDIEKCIEYKENALEIYKKHHQSGDKKGAKKIIKSYVELAYYYKRIDKKNMAYKHMTNAYEISKRSYGINDEGTKRLKDKMKRFY